jgi:hypothetical protein
MSRDLGGLGLNATLPKPRLSLGATKVTLVSRLGWLICTKLG